MDCPACKGKLKRENYPRISVFSCENCHGTWYEGDSLASALGSGYKKGLLELSHCLLHQQTGHRLCPTCQVAMTEKNFGEGAHPLNLDQCPTCRGIWFDLGELKKTKELVLSRLGNRSPQWTAMRAYPVSSAQRTLPRTLPRPPAYALEEEEKRDEKQEEAELIAGADEAEVTLGIWFFTIFTGLPLECYNPPKRRVPWVVISLILFNTLVAIYEFSILRESQLETFIHQYGAVPASLDFWTIFSHMFLHGGWVHLLGNMYFLWLFGDNVEDRLGHGRFLLFYLLCGLGAVFCQTWVILGMSSNDKLIPMVGASGAIAGVMGAYIYLFPRSKLYQRIWIIPYPFKVPVVLYLLFWVGLQFVGHFMGAMGVAWWAHLGGFFVGLVLTVILTYLSKEAPAKTV